MNFYSIYIPLVLQNVVTLSVNLADNIMLGAYSETALAGVAAVNQIQFVYQQLITALGDGLVIFGSQYWGNGQIQPIKRLAHQRCKGRLYLQRCYLRWLACFRNKRLESLRRIV